MFSFAVLPGALNVELLLTWINTADIGRLDSALCNSVERESYLRAGRCASCVLDLPTDRHSRRKYDAEKFTGWLIKRHFSTSVLDVDGILVQNDVERKRYLLERGQHIREVHVGSSTSSTRLYTQILKVICEHCPYVQFFRCHGTGKPLRSYGISNATIRHVAAQCPHLQRVTLQSSPQLTDTALIDLAHHCPQLRSFHIASIGCTHVGLQRLVEGCSMSEELRVRCRDVGPALEAIPLNCPQLRVLAVTGILASARLVTLLAEHCPKLEFVRVFGREIGDTEVAALITRCEKLVRLDVSRTSVTGLGLRALAPQCKALQYIAVDADVDPFETSGVSAPRGRCISPLVSVICVAELKCALSGTPYNKAGDHYEDEYLW
jgi:hypothetical protein